MGCFNKYAFLQIFVVLLLVEISPICTEETCNWLPDGRKVCEEEGTKVDHNVWTEPLDEAAHTQNEAIEQRKATLKFPDVKEMELELLVMFAGQLNDWEPNEDFTQYKPEVIVFAILKAFNAFDRNDDGYLDYGEYETIVSERKSHENLDKIRDELTDYSDGKISIFECFNIFKNLNAGREIVPLLTPFEKLQYLSPANAKKIIQGSVQMFIDSDKNLDSKLNKDEFSFGMNKANEKRKEMGAGESPDVTPDQLDAIFSLVDKDKDGYLTYIEFQGTIPEKPKSFEDAMNEVFDMADTNEDGALTESEFTSYLEIRSKKENSQVMPSKKEIIDAFEKLDVDGDEALSRVEIMGMFDEMQKAQQKRMIEAFQSFDKDSDGFLSLDEIQVIVEGIEQNSGQQLDANVFMTMLDQDKDKKVSLEEMTKILSKIIQ